MSRCGSRWRRRALNSSRPRCRAKLPSDTGAERRGGKEQLIEQECADGGVPRLRRGAGCDRAGLRDPGERDLPVQLAAADPQLAQRHRMDPGGDRRARVTGPQALVYAARPLGRRVLLGPVVRRASMPKVTYIEYDG